MQLLDLFFPKRCVGCHRFGAYICSHCLNRLRPLDHPPLRSATLNGLIAVFPYKGLAKQLVVKLKYKFVTDITATMLEISASYGQLDTLPHHPWLVTGVPLHPTRERWRGFNQAKLLAKGLAVYGHWQFSPHLLQRTRNTTPQMTLSGPKRRRNLRGAFATVSPALIKNRHILLVDDVWTTGTTMTECAKVLKQAGAASVWGFILARS